MSSAATQILRSYGCSWLSDTDHMFGLRPRLYRSVYRDGKHQIENDMSMPDLTSPAFITRPSDRALEFDQFSINDKVIYDQPSDDLTYSFKQIDRGYAYIVDTKSLRGLEAAPGLTFRPQTLTDFLHFVSIPQTGIVHLFVDHQWDVKQFVRNVIDNKWSLPIFLNVTVQGKIPSLALLAQLKCCGVVSCMFKKLIKVNGTLGTSDLVTTSIALVWDTEFRDNNMFDLNELLIQAGVS